MILTTNILSSGSSILPTLDTIDMPDKRVIDSQRPVWKEQWCARRDAIESSGGKEDQFWVTGFSEPLPPPLYPNQHPRPLQATAYEGSPSHTHSTNPHSSKQSSKSFNETRLDPSEGRAFIPPASSRRPVFSSAHLRKQPEMLLVPPTHAYLSNREFSRKSRSASPYSSNFSMKEDRKLHRNGRRDVASPFSGEWNDFHSSFDLPSNPQCDVGQSKEESPLLSLPGSSQMPPTNFRSYPTYNQRVPDQFAGTSASASEPQCQPPASLPQVIPPSTIQYMGYSNTNVNFQHSDLVSRSLPSGTGTGQRAAFPNSSELSFDLWPYESSAAQREELLTSGPSSWGPRQTDAYATMVPPTSTFQYSSAYDLPLSEPSLADNFTSTHQFQSLPYQFSEGKTDEHRPQPSDFMHSSPKDDHTDNQFDDFYFTNSGKFLESSSNFVDDEFGLFQHKLEEQDEAPWTLQS